jgi:transposase-like protein
MGSSGISQGIKRRTRVLGTFPHEASWLRLVSVVLTEIDEQWQVGRTCLTLEAEDPLPW